MRKKQLIALFLFILTSISFAQKTAKEPTNNTVEKNLHNNEIVTEETNNNINTVTNTMSHRHSLGVNFGPTIFYMLTAPTVFNLIFPSGDPSHLKTQGTFGLGITYTYRASEKIDINVDTTFAAMKTYYDNSKINYNGNVYALGFSVGGRFYCNSKDKASGFFLMPKIGTTIFMTENREYIKESSTYTNRMSYMYDFYISGELGFRIDVSRGLGVNSGIRPFLDISIIDIGLSYNNLIRLVPLPRFAIGILF